MSPPDAGPRFPHAVLVREIGPGLTLYARQWCESPEDIVQDAFLQLFCQKESPTNPKAWLFQVVRHSAMNQTRSRSRRRKRERAVCEVRSPWFEYDLDQAIDAKAATRALRVLPIESREIVVSRLWGSLSFDEIAELLEISPRTASRRYQAAINQLRSQLGVAAEKSRNHSASNSSEKPI